jgi:hypothetical protein
VIIKNGEVVIDAVGYDGGPNFPDLNGASMQLDPDHTNATDNDMGEYWCEATYVYGLGDKGTPGVENTLCEFNDPPVASCQDVTVEADADCLGWAGTEDVDNGSYDPNGDPITLDLNPEGPYPLGVTEVILTVTDDKGAADQCTATITVVDTEAPVLEVVEDPFEIWPPNHKYESFEVSDFVTGVSDNCSPLNIDDVYITEVTSDEEENATGGGDGNTWNDMVIENDCQTVKLRKERDGSQNGRVYTIHLALDDESGNQVTATCQVQVPKSASQGAVDDGPVYSVTCSQGFNPLAGLTETQGSRLNNFPNPFYTTTNIQFIPENSGHSSITVLNTTGQQLVVLYSGNVNAGERYDVEFNGTNLPEGIYFVRWKTPDGEIITRKMVLMK